MCTYTHFLCVWLCCTICDMQNHVNKQELQNQASRGLFKSKAEFMREKKKKRMELRTKAQQNLLISQGFDVLLREQDVEGQLLLLSAFLLPVSVSLSCSLYIPLQSLRFSYWSVFQLYSSAFHLPSHNLLLICSYTLTLLKSLQRNIINTTMFRAFETQPPNCSENIQY